VIDFRGVDRRRTDECLANETMDVKVQDLAATTQVHADVSVGVSPRRQNATARIANATEA
jgi:hypothetical protein